MGKMKIISLRPEKIRRLKAVEINPGPDEPIVKVTGRNRQGKTSLLDSILYALYALAGERQIPPRPVIRVYQVGRQTIKGMKPKDRPPTKRPAVAELPEPTFDKDGYPTEETLKVIRDFSAYSVAETRPLLEFIATAWKYAHWAQEVRPGMFVFATGGWSGNEDLIDALKRSRAWGVLDSHAITLSGGFVVIAIGRKAMAEVARKRQEIIDWAWGN